MNPHRTPGVKDPCPGCERPMPRLRYCFLVDGRTSPEFCSSRCLDKWRAANPESTEEEVGAARWTPPAPASNGALRTVAGWLLNTPNGFTATSLTLILFTVGVVLGCTSIDAPIRATNAARTTGHELAAFVATTCAEPYARAAEMTEAKAYAEVARLDALRCPEALAAQTALSDAHGTMVALLTAIQAGQCQATIAAPAPARCDLGRATMALVEAGARLARAVDALDGGAR